MRALVIDDSRTMRSILRGALKNQHFADIVEAGNGKEALFALQASGPFEIALVDWNMPEMDGLQFITEVRKLEKYKDMRLMMVTTEGELGHVSRALSAGADEYLMKPFTNELIGAKLEILGLTAGMDAVPNG